MVLPRQGVHKCTGWHTGKERGAVLYLFNGISYFSDLQNFPNQLCCVGLDEQRQGNVVNCLFPFHYHLVPLFYPSHLKKESDKPL